MTNPMMDQGSQGAPINKQLRTQMTTVLEVSIVERWAADAYLVVAIPKLLKAAIEQILPAVYKIRILLSTICWKP